MTLPRRKSRKPNRVDPDRVQSQGHMAWTRKHYDCAVADKPSAICGGAIHAHHVQTRGAGGGDNQVVPLCGTHHAEIHTCGHDTFEQRYNVDLHQMAADLWRADDYHRGVWLRKLQET